MGLNLDTSLNNYPGEYVRTCKFAPWLLALSEDDRNAVVKAMDNPDIPTRHIFKTLKAVGCPSSESTIRTHRLGECQHCEREQHGKHGQDPATN